jgi:hypothetical protein
LELAIIGDVVGAAVPAKDPRCSRDGASGRRDQNA